MDCADRDHGEADADAMNVTKRLGNIEQHARSCTIILSERHSAVFNKCVPSFPLPTCNAQSINFINLIKFIDWVLHVGRGNDGTHLLHKIKFD